LFTEKNSLRIFQKYIFVAGAKNSKKTKKYMDSAMVTGESSTEANAMAAPAPELINSSVFARKTSTPVQSSMGSMLDEFVSALSSKVHYYYCKCLPCNYITTIAANP